MKIKRLYFTHIHRISKQVADYFAKQRVEKKN
jgi:hypothetical protein